MQITNEHDYQQLIRQLKQNSNEGYRRFTKSLNSGDRVIGVSIPTLETIAKELKDNYEGFLKYNQHHYREEILLHGLVLSYLDKPLVDLEPMLDTFLTYSHSWETIDCTCSHLKVFKKEPEAGLNYIKTLLSYDDPFTLRMALVLLNDYYVTKDNAPFIYKSLESLTSTDYYVLMAGAWLIATLYTKLPEMTLKWLKKAHLNTFMIRKAQSKINDSKRVGVINKLKLKEIKND